MPNIYHPIFLLLLLGCSTSKPVAAQTDRALQLLQQKSSDVSPNNRQAAATTPIPDRLCAGILCIGLILFLILINKNFYEDFYRLDTQGNPDNTILYIDVMIIIRLIAINLSVALILAIPFGILVGKLENPKEIKIEEFFLSAKKRKPYKLY